LEQFLLVAKIIAPRGDAGFVRIQSFSDFPDRFRAPARFFIDFFGDMKEFVVEKSDIRGNEISLKFRFFDASADVDILTGKEMFVRQEDAVQLPDDTYYIHDLIGSEVWFGREHFGTLTDVLSMPANDVYLITGDDKKVYALAALKEYIESFDAAGKKIVFGNCKDFLLDYED